MDLPFLSPSRSESSPAPGWEEAVLVSAGRSCRAFLRLSSLGRPWESLLERDPAPIVGTVALQPQRCLHPGDEGSSRAGCQPGTPALGLLGVRMVRGHLPWPDAEYDSPAHPAPSTHPTCGLPLVFFCPKGLSQTSKSGQIYWSDTSYLLSTS